jgi:hypothetical protein
MAETINISAEETGPNDPNQPLPEGAGLNTADSPAMGEAPPPTQGGYEVPDKFVMEDGSVDVEALAKSYAELERGAHVPSEAHAETNETHVDGVLSQEEMNAYSAQLMEHGDITEESYDSLEERGFSRDLVSAYVEGQKAVMAQQQSSVFEAVGGQEAYNSMTSWAQENLSPEEIKTYDAAMSSGNMDQIMFHIKGLSARYNQQAATPTLLQGEVGPASATSAFRSWSEVTAAMKDPRYQNDPAYQKDVTNRLAVSNLG